MKRKEALERSLTLRELVCSTRMTVRSTSQEPDNREQKILIEGSRHCVISYLVRKTEPFGTPIRDAGGLVRVTGGYLLEESSCACHRRGFGSPNHERMQ